MDYEQNTNKPKIKTSTKTNDNQDANFVADVRGQFSTLETEISERNQSISTRDDYVYSDRLEKSLNIPLGHDHTPVNWLRRTVEIHKNMFMSRGFQVTSTYDTKNLDSAADKEDQKRLQIENDKQKEYAEARQQLIKAIISDNGGDALWSALAENASAVGDSCIKAYYDEKEEKYEICQIESIENVYALWSKDDFREVDAYAYVYQVSKQEAISDYGADENVATSPAGSPLEVLSATGVANQFSGQPMVSILEVTGKVEGWASEKGKLKKVAIGKETELNVLIVGDKVTRIIDDPKKIPKYYILPNKRQRRRPWGMSDISDAAVYINLTYVETLSDWRTAASKTNFNKYKAYGFGPDSQIPAPEPRKIEYLPLDDGQDIVELNQSQTDGIDWSRQLDECKEQFVRETGISRVLFDDPSVTLNSNQALLTSMKPTSDIAEAKKQLWSPIIIKIFTDALETIAEFKPEIKELVSDEDSWSLRVAWPSLMQKEDPVFQSMLLNRFNAGTMSLQSYVEAQGESKEEIDRIRDELTDPVTAAILGKQTPLIAQTLINAATTDIQAWYQSIMAAIQQPGVPGTPGMPGAPSAPGVNPNGGGAVDATIATQANNQPGQQPVSQPGSGASATSPQGAVAQTNQNTGG